MEKCLAVWLIVLAVISGCTVNINPAVNSSAGTGPVVPTQTFESPGDLTALHLTGRLVYLSGGQPVGNASISIQSLNLATGSTTVIFQAPSTAFIYAASVSPDAKQVVLSYTPTYDFPALYILPLDGSASPEILFSPPGKDDQYTEPVWSPDGRWIYFVHSNFDPAAQKAGQLYPFNEIQRLQYPGGTPELVAVNAYWPRLSLDGSRLLYVMQNPKNNQDYLTIADPDGSHPNKIQLNGPDVPTVIDAPTLLPDGKTILLSAPTPVHSASLDWFESTFWVHTVSAHSVPSEWWTVPLTGGTITQLTHIQSTSLYAAISPDGNWIACFSGNGVFLMHPDGTDLTMVVKAVGGIAGTVNWIP